MITILFCFNQEFYKLLPVPDRTACRRNAGFRPGAPSCEGRCGMDVCRSTYYRHLQSQEYSWYGVLPPAADRRYKHPYEYDGKKVRESKNSFHPAAIRFFTQNKSHSLALSVNARKPRVKRMERVDNSERDEGF